MPNFAYIIKDVKGARVEGILKADSLDQAVDKLAKEGSTIISVKAASEGAFKGKLSLSDKIMLSIYKWRTGSRNSGLLAASSHHVLYGLTIEKASGSKG